VPYFTKYLKENSDASFLVTLEEGENGVYKAGPYLKASRLADTQAEEHAEWRSTTRC
jgi:nitrate reductase alpha subunit